MPIEGEELPIEGEELPDEESKSLGSALLKGMKSVMLMIALSLHAVFAGIAIGTASDSGDAWTIGASVLLHKWAEGITLVRNSRVVMSTVTCILTFRE